MLDIIPRFSLILWVSITVLDVLADHTPALGCVEALSCYEAFATLAGRRRICGPPLPVLQRLLLTLPPSDVVTILANFIAFAVALELYYNVFDPRIGLPTWRPRHVVIMIAVSLGMAITLGLLLAARNGGSWTRTMVTMEQVTSVALWATFCFLLIYSRLLGFTWARPAGIAIGFILYLTVSVISVFIRARLSLGPRSLPARLRMAAYFLSLAWWAGFRARRNSLKR